MIAQKLTDMKLRLETSRMLLYQVGWLRKQGKSAVLESAMAKLHISENWVQSCQDAIQIHGGYGYTTEYELERDLRDAMGSYLYSGDFRNSTPHHCLLDGSLEPGMKILLPFKAVPDPDSSLSTTTGEINFPGVQHIVNPL